MGGASPGAAPYNEKHTNERGPLEYQLQLAGRQARAWAVPSASARTRAETFLRARWSQGNYSLGSRRGGDFDFDALLDIKKDGKTVATIERGAADGYDHRSYTFAPDGKSIISGGSNGYFHAFDLQGKKIGDFIGHEGVVWAVAPSARRPLPGLRRRRSDRPPVEPADARADRQPVPRHRRRMGDVDAAGLLHGLAGRRTRSSAGRSTRAPRTRPTTSVQTSCDTHLNRPDIVEKAIILASAEQAIRESPGTTFKLVDLLARPVPKFRIVSPAAGTSLRSGRAEVKIDVEAVRDPIKVIRVQVNGRQVDEMTPETGTGGFAAGLRTLDVPLGKGRNDIRITLSNDIGDKAETITLNQEGDGDARPARHAATSWRSASTSTRSWARPAGRPATAPAT